MKPNVCMWSSGDHGVQQGVVAFAATPKHKVGPAQALGDFQHFLDGRSSIREHLWVGGSGSTAHVAFVRKEIAGAPQKLDARLAYTRPHEQMSKPSHKFKWYA